MRDINDDLHQPESALARTFSFFLHSEGFRACIGLKYGKICSEPCAGRRLEFADTGSILRADLTRKVCVMGIELEEGENPVVREIRRRIQWDLGDLTIERLVVKYGSSFKGIERPKGYRLRAEKQCYMNSFCLADAGHGDAHRGFYVEGFVLRGDHLFQHAWVTPDGRHAIDVTLRGPASENHFFGIPFPTRYCSPRLVAGRSEPVFPSCNGSIQRKAKHCFKRR
jgi:hypothetical protein